MIDNYEQAMELVEKMQEHLPIPARVTKALVLVLRDKGVKIPTRADVQIETVIYLGDEGGIGCGIQLAQQVGEVLVASLTHLRVKNKHPLAKEIRAYQVARTRKLARVGSTGKPASYSIKPPKRH